MTEKRNPHVEYEHALELEKRSLATGAVACAREALRIACEVDAGRIPRGRAEVVLSGLLSLDPRQVARLLDAKLEPSDGSNQVPLVTAIQQVITGTGSADEMRAALKAALDAFWAKAPPVSGEA